MNILSITGQCLVLCKAPSRAITSCRHLGMDSTIAHLALHCTATTAKQQNPFSYIPFPDKKFSSDRADFWRNDAILMYLYWEKKSSHLVSPLRRYLTLKRAHVLRRWLYKNQYGHWWIKGDLFFSINQSVKNALELSWFHSFCISFIKKRIFIFFFLRTPPFRECFCFPWLCCCSRGWTRLCVAAPGCWPIGTPNLLNTGHFLFLFLSVS